MNPFTYNPSQYTGFRPLYPNSLFTFLKKMIDSDALVLECGAGSGQGSQGLSQHFKYVIATDLSFDLLSEAPDLPNIYYVQSCAEQLSIRQNSINLVCVAQAIHWFSHNSFYNEVNRVLKPDGMIAVWGYNQAVIEPVIDQVIKKLYLKMTSSQNFSRERQYLYDNYRTLPFPFKRIFTPEFYIKIHWNLIDLIGYMYTWPGILEYQKKFDTNLVDEIKDELALAWGDPLNQKLITWPIYLLVGRVV